MLGRFIGQDNCRQPAKIIVAVYEYFRRSLSMREKAYGMDHLAVSNNLQELALIHYNQDDYDISEKLYERALAIRERTQGVEPDDVAQLSLGLADVLYCQNRLEKAFELYLRALSIWEKIYEKNHFVLAIVEAKLAKISRVQGQYQKAKSLYLHAIKVLRKNNHADLTAALNGLGSTYESLCEFKKAESYYKQAISTSEEMQGKGSIEASYYKFNLANLYHLCNRYKESLAMYEESYASLEKKRSIPDPSLLKTILCQMTEVYRATQQEEKALLCEQKATEHNYN